MEPVLRQLGMPVKLVKGVVHLEREYLVCRRGDVLSPEQCRILVSNGCVYTAPQYSFGTFPNNKKNSSDIAH